MAVGSTPKHPPQEAGPEGEPADRGTHVCGRTLKIVSADEETLTIRYGAVQIKARREDVKIL